MKKFIKIISVLFVFVLTLSFAGCKRGESQNVNNNKSQIIAMISELFDNEELNLTLTGEVGYKISEHKIGNPKQSQEETFKNIVFEIDGLNAHVFIPNQYEAYMIDGWSYERKYKEIDEQFAWTGFETFFDYERIFEGSEFIPSLANDIIGEGFYNFVNFNPNWVTAESSPSGTSKLTISADLKEALEGIRETVTNKANSTLQELIDELLAIHYNQDLNLEKIIIDVKENITETSTIEDVVNFIGSEFGVKVDKIFSIFDYIEDVNNTIPYFENSVFISLSDNFFEIIEIENNADFSSFLDDLLDNYLCNPEYTLAYIINEIEENQDIISRLKGIYELLDYTVINECSFEVSFEVSTENCEEVNILIAANIDLTLNESANYIAEINGNISLINIGKTVVSLPEDIEIEKGTAYFKLNPNDLIEDSEVVIENVNLGNWNEVFYLKTIFVQNEEHTLIYNNNEHTLTISASAVNYIIESNFLIRFMDTNESFQINFFLF